MATFHTFSKSHKIIHYLLALYTCETCFNNCSQECSTSIYVPTITIFYAITSQKVRIPHALKARMYI